MEKHGKIDYRTIGTVTPQDHCVNDPPGARRRLDEPLRRTLAEVFPGSGPLTERMAGLLDRRPDDPAAFEEFTGQVRRLVTDGNAPDSGGGRAAAGFARYAVDVPGDDDAELPAVLTQAPVRVCEAFALALRATGVEPGVEQRLSLGGGLGRLWNGAHELLRQAAYFAMKQRAGTVGRKGLGPSLAVISRSSPGLRIHLVGHSFGARLASFALSGLPSGMSGVKSVTLLQGAFSHYAFAERLPHARNRSGALRGAPGRVDGPVVSCHSRHDTAPRVLYPIASRVGKDSAGFSGFDPRWGAIGHNGIQAVGGCKRLSLEEALRGPLPRAGCVSVDAAAVVRRGSPPAGAHSDICHEELARLVLAAGRIGD